MSIATNSTPHTEYPESDGRPMGETDTHRRWMIRIDDLLRHRYRGQHVYIGCDLLVYHDSADPSKYVVPDHFVVFDCDPSERRVFKTWEEQRSPDVVIEVTSRSTKRIDLREKPIKFGRMGVKEYFLFDPTAEYLTPALQGFHLREGVMQPIPPNGPILVSETLEVTLELNGLDLELRDRATSQLLRTEAESERITKEQERAAKEQERAARLVAEQRVRELEEQLRRQRDA